jgi:hypothetical protein
MDNPKRAGFLRRLNVVGRVIAIGLFFLGLVIVDYLTVGGRRFGLALSVLMLGIPAFAIAGAQFNTFKERRSVLVAGAAAIAAALLGVSIWKATPAQPSLIIPVLDSVRFPQGVTLVSEDESGNIFCFDSCPSVSRTYRNETGDPISEAEMLRLLESAGLEHARIRGHRFLSATSGGLHPIAVTVTLPESDAGKEIHINAAGGSGSVAGE